MIVDIKQDGGKFRETFRLEISRTLSFGDFEKILLKADVGYWMRIYNSERKSYDFVTACEKIEKTTTNYIYVEDIDAIAILDFKYINKDENISDETLVKKGATSLVAEIYFKPQNRAPNSKIVRWPIRMYDNNGFSVKRIPIIIKPFWIRTFFFVLYCCGAVILSESYSYFSSYLSGETTLNFFNIYLGVKIGIVTLVVWGAIFVYDLTRTCLELRSFR